MSSGWIDLPIHRLPTVSVYSLLPSAVSNLGFVYGVVMDEGANPSGIYYSDGSTWILITDASGTGSITDGLNVGTGAQVFKDKVGQTLRFRTLTGTGATITQSTDEINIQPNFADSASPGFSTGRDGPLTVGDWLLYNSVPSNKVGLPILVTSPIITTIAAMLGSTDTVDFEIYEHDGTTFTLVYTFSMTAQRRKTTTGLSVSLTSGKVIGVKLASGSVSNGAGLALTLSGGT